MGSDSPPSCPYKPLGFPCIKEYGHGSPHALEIEAAKIDSMLDVDYSADVLMTALRDAPRPKVPMTDPEYLVEQAVLIIHAMQKKRYLLLKAEKDWLAL